MLRTYSTGRTERKGKVRGDQHLLVLRWLVGLMMMTSTAQINIIKDNSFQKIKYRLSNKIMIKIIPNKF